MAARTQDRALAGWDYNGYLVEQHTSQPKLTPPPAPYVDSNNWVLHAKASFPHVYDPGYHTTLYELLFDVWMELGKVGGEGMGEGPSGKQALVAGWPPGPPAYVSICLVSANLSSLCESHLHGAPCLHASALELAVYKLASTMRFPDSPVARRSIFIPQVHE
eukprot:1153154-Pelagomonas_calceolata.AAC.8